MDTTKFDVPNEASNKYDIFCKLVAEEIKLVESDQITLFKKRAVEDLKIAVDLGFDKDVYGIYYIMIMSCCSCYDYKNKIIEMLTFLRSLIKFGENAESAFKQISSQEDSDIGFDEIILMPIRGR